ncbi:MAG: CHASE3 domain-containing protein [Acidobacteriaceae bacterium]|nr:CHASE3 domain-containing protein [Acidobacteriaceae bacterium]
MTLPAQAKTKRRLAFLFSIPLVFSIVFFCVDVAAEHADIEMLKIRAVYSSVTELRSLARDAEAGEQGFLLSSDERDLMPLEQGELLLHTQISNCLSAAKERPEVLPQVQKLAYVVETRYSEAEQVVDVERTRGVPAALNVLRAGNSQKTMGEVLSLTSSVLNQLDSESGSYERDDRRLYTRIFVFYAASTLIIIAVLAWLYHELVSYLHERDAALGQLRAANANLEERIAERTRDLTEANQELQQFAYVASHDLQEPLRTITSFSQLLETRYRGRLDGDADEFIGYIVSSARRMTDLINGLLALVRLRKPGQPGMPVSFEKILEEAEVALQAAIRESGAEVEHGPLPSLLIDEVQFTQVAQNLIGNAIKYRREEPPHIRVDASKVGEDWVFSFRDNGRGFNQQFAERIFGLFQRLGNGGVEGTGMGLSIARRIVERHGGRIWAESVEGTGSTFYFSLPLSLERKRTDANNEYPSPAVPV